MRTWSGDVWDFFKKAFIVIPVNIGYKAPNKKTGIPGPNVMGRGLAAQAVEYVPGLPQLYGEYCAKFGAKTEVTFDLSTGLVMFPTKPMAANPSMSWKNDSTMELVEKSARELASMTYMTKELFAQHENSAALESDDVYVPYVGCGNGGLPEDKVIPMLQSILTDDRFILVTYRPF